MLGIKFIKRMMKMDNNIEKSCKVWKIVVFFVPIAVILILFALLSDTFTLSTPTKIDTSDVVSPLPISKRGVALSNVLKVAVGAMISPEKTRDYYTDMIELVGRKIGHPVEIIQAKTYEQINAQLEEKTLDFAFVCSGPYVKGRKKFGMEILVVPVAHNEKVYYSYMIASKDSTISGFDDLRGKKFAFTDPNSNTGCLVPLYMLSLRNETAESFFSAVSYTYSHDNSIKAVAEGLVDGAAVDSLIWEYLRATDPKYVSMTKIVGKSPPYGIPPIVVHPAMNTEIKKTLKNVFLNMHKDPQGAELLKKMGIERFEEGDDKMYDSVRAMQDYLEGQIPSAMSRESQNAGKKTAP